MDRGVGATGSAGPAAAGPANVSPKKERKKGSKHLFQSWPMLRLQVLLTQYKPPGKAQSPDVPESPQETTGRLCLN